MGQFEGVTVIKEANIYFNGQVSSRTVLFPDGTKKTLGLMLPGEYEFGTAEAEQMEIMAGEVLVKLPGSEEWVKFTGGQSFEAPANAKFQLQVSVAVDYCCSYLA